MQHVSEVLKIHLPANDNEHVRLYITKPKIHSKKDANLVLVPTTNPTNFPKFVIIHFGVELHYILKYQRIKAFIEFIHQKSDIQIADIATQDFWVTRPF